MAEPRLEKRIVKAGIRLCEDRVSRSGKTITADDVLLMKVRTFSPLITLFYWIVGLGFVVFGVWTQFQLRNMAISLTPVFLGIANISYGAWGRPRKVKELVSEQEIVDLTADIVQQFVAKMDAKRKV